jgi:hypothetical protein
MNKLIRIMNNVAKDQSPTSNLYFGTVISTSPLKIKVNDLELTSQFIELSALCTETFAANGTTLLWRGLQENDVVKMLRLNGGQLYYVIERSVIT